MVPGVGGRQPSRRPSGPRATRATRVRKMLGAAPRLGARVRGHDVCLAFESEACVTCEEL